MHIIGTVNQEDSYIMETLNTLNFITKARKIKIDPKMNFQTKNDGSQQKQMALLLERIKVLEEENQKLKEDQERLREKAGGEKAAKLKKRNKDLAKNVSVLKSKIMMLEQEKVNSRRIERSLKKSFQSVPKKVRKKASLKHLQIKNMITYLQPKMSLLASKNKVKEKSLEPKKNSSESLILDKDKTLKKTGNSNPFKIFAPSKRKSSRKSARKAHSKTSRVKNHKTNDLRNILNNETARSTKPKNDFFASLGGPMRGIATLRSSARKISSKLPSLNLRPSRVLGKKKSLSKKNMKRVETEKAEKPRRPPKEVERKHEIDQILTTFSIYSKVQDRSIPMNDISLSTINHLCPNNVSYNKRDAEAPNISQLKSFVYVQSTDIFDSIQIEKVLVFSRTKSFRQKAELSQKKLFSFIYKKQKSLASKETSTDKLSLDLEKWNQIEEEEDLQSRKKEKENTKCVTSLLSLKESCPKKYNKMFDKLIAKIKTFEKNNQSLERQLRNRNKDYLYALKKIENCKDNQILT